MYKSESTRNKIFSGLFWKFGERITAQLISLLISIILARILSPADYGMVSMVMVFITIANVFVANGFGNALIQKKNADNLDFSSVFYINIGIGVILYFILFVAASFIANFYGMPLISPVLRVLGIQIIIASINSVQQAYVSRNMLFKRFFWSSLFGTLFSGIVGVIMAYTDFGVWALVTQYLANTCINTVILWFTVKWRPDFKCSWWRAKSLLAFGWKLLLSGLLDTGYTQVRSLIIGKKYSSSDLAYYNQGEKYPNFIVTNINTSISSVLFPAMSQVQDYKDKIKQMTRRSIQISSYIMWPAMIGFAVVAESFVSLVLTEKWLPCVPFIRIFCFTYGLWPIHTANLQAINALGRSDIFLKLEIVKKTIGIIAIILTMDYGPLAMAYGLIITDVIGMFINAFPNVKLLGYHYQEQFRDLLPSFIMACIMAVIVYPISLLNMSNILTLIVQVIVGGIVYLMESLILKYEPFIYLLSYAKERLKK